MQKCFQRNNTTKVLSFAFTFSVPLLGFLYSLSSVLVHRSLFKDQIFKLLDCPLFCLQCDSSNSSLKIHIKSISNQEVLKMAEAAIAKGAEIAMEHTVDSISTLLGYIWNYKANFENLEGQHRNLDDTRAQVQHSVDEAMRNGEEIEQKVVSWLDRVEKINAEATKIIEDNQQADMWCFEILCPDLKKRYLHSRNAAVKAMEVSELEKDGNLLGKVSYRNLPEETWHPSSKPFEDFESRTSTLTYVINALSNPDVHMVGVHGMGGIGKTTLAREVGRKTEESKIFDVVVFVEISDSPNVRTIQGVIADKLGLEFRQETEPGRANALCERLKKESKILLILDNIWESLDLEKVGIPFNDDHRGCKLLLTARKENLLSNEMGCEINFPIDILNKKEAWSLFKKKAGSCVEGHDLRSLAFDVAKECGGLPIAIVTVAKALKNKEECEWKSALHELRHPSIESLEESVTTKTYSCIKLSYDHLKSKELKLTFLLCSTMIFISNASIEGLLRYAIGLRLFNTINTMEAARDRVNTLIQMLKKSCLLLDTPKGEHFFMHDVVRDVGRSIALRDRHMFTMKENLVMQDLAEENTNCTSIILQDIAELPEELDCPQLEFLYVKPKTRFHKIPNKFFAVMPKLGVLHLIEMALSPLPTSFHLLKKLQTLHLDRRHLGDIAEIGNLKNLKIVVFSSDIERLPKQIGELAQLKVLDLSKCSLLKIIPPNTISRLTQLEELYMPDEFCKWQGVEGERSNASLGELEHLSQLTALQIYIPDAKLVPKGLLFQKLQRYTIYIGVDEWNFRYRRYNASRLLSLKYGDANISVEDGIIKQLKEIEELELIGKLGGVKNVLYELNRDGFPKLKRFDVERNPELVYIVDFPKQSEPCVAFPYLQTLSLVSLSSLEKICHAQFTLTPNSFCQLRTLRVQICVKLKNLFSSSIARHLSQLEEILVNSCKNMEEIFSIVGSENEEIVLEKLDSLRLWNLPKLRSFSYEEEVGSTSDQERQMKDTLMPLFDGKVKFRNLKTMRLEEINLKYVFSSSTLGSFVLLQRLDIRNCTVLEEIIRIDDLKNNVELPSLKTLHIEECHAMKSFIFSDKVTFPNLEEIKISNMDNLEMIWHNQLEDSQNVQNCQKLCKVSVKKCQSLKNLFPASVLHTPKWSMLKKLNVIGCDKIDALELFNIQEVISKNQRDIVAQEKVLPFLEELGLDGRKMKMVWQRPFPEILFPKLKFLEIQNDESTGLSPNSLPRSHNLEKLSLENSSYEWIFSCEEVEEYPQIKRLQVNGLGNLKQIWKQDSKVDTILQNLESLVVRSCGSLVTLLPPSTSFQNLTVLTVNDLISSSTVKSLTQLKVMEIEGCKMMTEVVTGDGAGIEDEINFKNLKSLNLISLSRLRKFCSGNYNLNFPSLVVLHVAYCPKMRNFSSITANAPMLREIKLDWESSYYCDGDINKAMERIHEKKVFSSVKLTLSAYEIKMILQKFQEHKFSKVKTLEVFDDESTVFPLDILKRFPNLNCLQLSDTSYKEIFSCEEVAKHAETLAQIKRLRLEKLDDLEQMWKQDSISDLILRNLESLTVFECNNLITLVPTSASFQNLSVMNVSGCNGLRSLVTATVANSLVQLERMWIKNCNEMTEIVAIGDVKEDEIIFNKLRTLELIDLSNLSGFYSGNYTLNFTSLDELQVTRCPKMKFFSLGISSTPMLQQIEWGSRKYNLEGDLNITIQRIHEEMNAETSKKDCAGPSMQHLE